MTNGKRKEFNIVDELKKDGIGPTSWEDLGGDGKILFNRNNIPFTYVSNAGLGVVAETIESPFGLFVVGQKYTVVVDGVEYADLVAQEEEGGIGVRAPATDPTSLEPFFVVTAEQNGSIALVIAVVSRAETHDIKIQVGKINTIPTEYLPEGYITEADKTELVNSVIAALPTWNGGSY